MFAGRLVDKQKGAHSLGSCHSGSTRSSNEPEKTAGRS